MEGREELRDDEQVSLFSFVKTTVMDSRQDAPSLFSSTNNQDIFFLNIVQVEVKKEAWLTGASSDLWTPI